MLHFLTSRFIKNQLTLGLFLFSASGLSVSAAAHTEKLAANILKRKQYSEFYKYSYHEYSVLLLHNLDCKLIFNLIRSNGPTQNSPD